MTQNQINYAKLVEERRHNLASEGLTGGELQETKRHNTQSENLNWYTAQETVRHNQNTEGLNWYIGATTADLNTANAVKARHSVTLDDLKYDLDLNKFEEQKWKDLWDTWNDSKRVQIAQQELDAQIAEWVNRYDLDVEKWVNGGYANQASSTIRNGVQAGKDAATILTSLLPLILKLLA